MDSRRWWLLAGSVPVGLGCVVSAARPQLHSLGELAVAGAGVLAATVLWFAAGGSPRPRAWRLLAVATLFPALGALGSVLAPPIASADLAVLRWVPTVPGWPRRCGSSSSPAWSW